MTDLDPSAELDLITAHTAQPLTTDALHRLLESTADRLGSRPHQIVGPYVRLRWRLGDRLLELAPRVNRSGGQALWRVKARLEDGERVLTEEHVALEHATDDMALGSEPFRGFDVPYVWNLGLVDAREWANDLMTPLPSWTLLVRHLGETIGRLPDDLAALPPSWLDDPITISSGYGLEVAATREGVRVSTGLNDDGWYSAAFQIPAATAPAAGRLLAETWATSFSPGVPLEQVDMEMDGPRGTMVSGFTLGVRFAFAEDREEFEETYADYLRSVPDYPLDLEALLALTEWHEGPVAEDGIFRRPVGFPEWAVETAPAADTDAERAEDTQPEPGPASEPARPGVVGWLKALFGR